VEERGDPRGRSAEPDGTFGEIAGAGGDPMGATKRPLSDRRERPALSATKMSEPCKLTTSGGLGTGAASAAMGPFGSTQCA
jgi:hypothetical protein